MFDRGLIAVADDLTVLVSGNKVPRDVADRLLLPEGKLRLPNDKKNWPHPENLRWHRENIFGQFISNEPTPWQH
jgi:putative restriction endonuclease